MKRGTTQTINLNFQYNLGELNITAFYVTFNQDNETILEKELADIEIKESTAIVNLTQEDTLKFKANSVIEIQGRLKVDDKAYATNIVKTSVGRILKEGVI